MSLKSQGISREADLPRKSESLVNESSGPNEALTLARRLVWNVYTLAIVVSVVSLCVRAALASWIGDPLLIACVIPILVSAYAGGLLPGLLSTLIIAWGTGYLLLPSAHSLYFSRSADVVQWAILIAAGAIISALIEPMRRARGRLTTTNASLKAQLEIARRENDFQEKLSEKTEQRERILTMALASLNDFAYIFDRDDRFVFANQALLDLWGIPLEAAVGKNFFDLGYPEDLARKHQCEVQSVFATKQSVKDETPYTSSAGIKGYYEYIFSPAFAADGTVEFVVGSTRDITARKQAEVLLQESEERFSSMFRAAATGIAISTPEGRFLQTNAAYCRMLGYTKEELQTRTFASLTHPDDLAVNLNLRDELLAGKRTDFVMEKRYLRKTGDIVWTRHSVSAVRAADGEVATLIVVAEDITERKRAEDVLVRQQTELQVLFDLIPAMLCFKDTRNAFLRVNKRLAEAAGRPIAEIEGKSAVDIFPNEADKYYADDLEVILSVKPKLEIVEKLQSADGKDMWVQTDKVPVCDKDGKVTGIVVMVQDITQRKLNEEALRLSESNMAAAQRIAHFGSWELELKDLADIASNPVRWSDEIFRIAGYEPGAVEASNALFFRHLPVEEHAMVQQAMASLIRDGGQYSIMHRIIRADGQERAVHEVAQIFHDEKTGRPIKVVGTTHDITERKLAEYRLHRLNRLHTVLSNCADAIVRTGDKQELFDAVCRIVVEDGLLRMVFVAEVDADTKVARPLASYGAGQEYLREPTSLIPTDGGPLSMGTVGTAIRTGMHDFCNDIAGASRMKPWHDTTVKNGLLANASFPLKMQGVTVAVLVLYAGEKDYFLEDEIGLMVTVAGNLSFALEALERERKRIVAEQKLQEYTKELERSNGELQQFAYVASHDLQEPLRAVAGCIQMLDEHNAGRLDERSRELMGYAVEGAKRMRTLIEDLLAYSRVGHKEINRAHINVRETVDKALHQLNVAIAESNAIVTVDPLPFAWADPVQIVQLFQNLIGNAIKFRTADRPEIRVLAEQANGETIFSVRDNGIGIAAEYHEKIFGIFKRLLSRRDYPGTGIGLAICKKIVERHNGRIWVESVIGQGSNFRFTLPAR